MKTDSIFNLKRYFRIFDNDLNITLIYIPALSFISSCNSVFSSSATSGRIGLAALSDTMGIQFVLMVNKQGQTRVAQYYTYKVCVLSQSLFLLYFQK